MNCKNNLNVIGSPTVRLQRAARGDRRSVRAGMTLLEVILAIAILGGSMAVLGELVRIGTRSARAARMSTTAQLLAESLLTEISLSTTSPTSTNGMIDDYAGEAWQYTTQVEQVDQQGLLAIAVTVQENKDLAEQPVSYTLMRWIIDPQVILDIEEAAAAASEASSGAASSSGTDSSASGSTSGAGTGTGTGTGGAP
jgi:type II secretion system protein I